MFDSNANLGKLIDIDCRLIDSEELLVVVGINPLLETPPFAKIIFPPREIVSASAAETSESFPFS